MEADILIVFLVASGLVGVWAHNWGRNGWGWALLAFLISPLISGIILLFVGRDKEQKIEKAAQEAAAIEKRKNELL